MGEIFASRQSSGKSPVSRDFVKIYASISRLFGVGHAMPIQPCRRLLVAVGS
jgi:hypothetical protein